MQLFTTLLAIMSSSVLGAVLDNPLSMSSATKQVAHLEQDRDLNAIGIMDFGANNPSGGYCTYSSAPSNGNQRNGGYRKSRNRFCQMDRGSATAGQEYDQYGDVSFADCQIKCDHNRACTGFGHYRIGRGGRGFPNGRRCQIWYYPAVTTEPVRNTNRYLNAWCYVKS